MRRVEIPSTEALNIPDGGAYSRHVLPEPGTALLPMTINPYDFYVLKESQANVALDEVESLKKEVARLRAERAADGVLISELRTETNELATTVARLAPFEDRVIDFEWENGVLKSAVKELIMDADNLLAMNATDRKTGLKTYETFTTLVEDELQEQREFITQHGLPEYENAVLMIDVDDFKDINTLLFHTGADEYVLVPAAEMLEMLVNIHGIAARFGGEEFLSFLRDMDREEVQLYVEDIQKTLNHLYIQQPGGVKQHIGFTIGIGRLRTHDALGTAIEDADIACIMGKKIPGKNQILHYADVDKNDPSVTAAQVKAHGKLMEQNTSKNLRKFRAF